jgi:hypothetical protein
VRVVSRGNGGNPRGGYLVASPAAQDLREPVFGKWRYRARSNAHRVRKAGQEQRRRGRGMADTCGGSGRRSRRSTRR